MNEEPRQIPISVPLTYPTLRGVFVAGLLLDLVLTFVPAYRTKVGSFLGFGGEERSLSAFDMIRIQLQNQSGWGVFNVAYFGAYAALVVLAWKQPKRWVFVTGAALAAFALLLELFIGPWDSIYYYPVPRLLHYVAGACVIAGFFARPPSRRAAPEQAA